ncbi:hypothetical protein K469DRAFT_595365, partial [Zopfia rhizophila CBS 207.26]
APPNLQLSLLKGTYADMEGNTVLQPKASKTCDDCKARKVRCVSDNADSQACINCIKRRARCHFSVSKRRVKRPAPESLAAINGGDALAPSLGATSSPAHRQQLEKRPSYLYIDHLLENRQASGRRRNESSLVKVRAHDSYGSSGLAFFSERRITSISNRLGHTKLRDIMEALASIINSRMNRDIHPSGPIIKFHSPSTPLQISDESAKSYIRAYFDYVHPMYPFLDRTEFEEKAFKPHLVHLMKVNPPFSALYHTVLALGCQYQDGGSFEPGKGIPWRLYQFALGSFSDILVPKETLVNAIFAHNSSCVQIGNMLTTEAARMAQLLGFNRATYHGENESACSRTFWVVYILEKMSSFVCGRASVLVDYDIGTPVPDAHEAVFGDFDWFLTMVRFSRLISKAYEMLFSVSATLIPAESCHAATDTVNNDLECWRKSIPEAFRPGDPFQPTNFADHSSMAVALRTHYHYYSVVIALSRLSLHVDAETLSRRQSESTKALMNAARATIELTRYIDTEAYAPVWILVSMPLSASFILFDFIVHNPIHPETKRNLSLLGVASGYFCRLEYASGGSLPSSPFSDFVHIAGQYVRDVDSGVIDGTAGAANSYVLPEQPTVTNPDPEASSLSVSVSNLSITHCLPC